MRRFALPVLAGLGGTLLAAPALTQQPAARPQPSTAIVLTLPDSGGYLINDQPIAWTELPAQLDAIYGARPEEGRVLHVAPVSAGRRADLAYVDATARQVRVRLVRDTTAR